MVDPVSRALSGICTSLDWPWRVNFPVAVTWISWPSAGTEPRSMGDVSANVAVGNWPVWMPWRASWPSRRWSSLWSVVRSAVMVAAVTWVPLIVRDPLTSGVRPTAVFAPIEASCSWTRYPTNELVESAKEPIEVSTFQVPSMPPEPPACDEAAGCEAAGCGEPLADVGTGGRLVSATAAGPAGWRNRYQSPHPPTATTARRATPTAMRIGRRERPGDPSSWILGGASILSSWAGSSRGPVRFNCASLRGRIFRASYGCGLAASPGPSARQPGGPTARGPGPSQG